LRLRRRLPTPNSYPPSQRTYRRISDIQLPFNNIFTDIWKYKDSFFSINFKAYIGEKCPICGKVDCYKPITEYYRNAIELFPYRKDKVPVARFLCDTIQRTFSLLPCQLIPYCQYTVAAIIGTLLKVHYFQTMGQRGYHGASLELEPDCQVTPFLIYTWKLLIIAGLRRAHPFLSERYPLSPAAQADHRQIIAAIYLYLQILSQGKSPRPMNVSSAVRYYSSKTGKHLFGTSSQDRNRSP
jgi:hypothetical protein